MLEIGFHAIIEAFISCNNKSYLELVVQENNLQHFLYLMMLSSAQWLWKRFGN